MNNINTGDYSASHTIVSVVEYGASAHTYLNSVACVIKTRNFLINSLSERVKNIQGETLSESVRWTAHSYKMFNETLLYIMLLSFQGIISLCVPTQFFFRSFVVLFITYFKYKKNCAVHASHGFVG
jgi:hypothetical protein